MTSVRVGRGQAGMWRDDDEDGPKPASPCDVDFPQQLAEGLWVKGLLAAQGTGGISTGYHAAGTGGTGRLHYGTLWQKGEGTLFELEPHQQWGGAL